MNTASEGKITKRQIEYINRIIKENEKRQKALNEYISEKGSGRIDSLSLSDASSVIDMLKKIPDSSVHSSEGGITPKQLSYLRSLTESPDRNTAAVKYLREKGKESIDLLSLDEASELIDKLRDISAGEGVSPKGKRATEKQIKYIESLSSDKSGKEVVKKYLSRAGKRELDELDSKEASNLIDQLRR